MSNSISLPFPYFADPNRGSPIFNGQIFVGQPDTDPEIPLNQIPVSYIDNNGNSVALPQPIRTNSGGYPVNSNGDVVSPQVGQSYSLKVLDRSDSQVFYFPVIKDLITESQNEIIDGVIFNGSNGEYIQNGDTVPVGTTHLRVLIDGKPTIVAMSPVATGLVSSLTEEGATIGGTSIVFRRLFNGGFVERYGASESASPEDNLAAYNAAITYCLITGETLSSLGGEIHTVSGTVDARTVRNVDLKAQLNGNGEFVTLRLGGYSTNTQQFYHQKVYKVNRGGSLPAIRISGSNKNTIIIGEASIVELYADTALALGGTDEYCAYNKIYINSCTTLQINSNPSTDGSVVQWVNENQIYLSFCLYFKMFDNGYVHNSNQIFGGNFEASDSRIEFETGIGNTFWNVRGENSLAVIFGENASNNTVLTDWYDSPNNPAAAASVTNNGLNNCVKNTADLYNDRLLLAGFNGSTLRVNGSACNVLGFNVGVSFDNALNTVTASPNQLLYTSQLVQISPNNQYFNVITEDKLSGGIRMRIEAFDSSMNPIASTGDDVLYPGATNEDAGFGENSTTITNSLGTRRIHIKNTAAKWIRLTVNASSAGCSFRRFEFSAITSDNRGKYELLTSAMLSDV